jgi:CubicO group peptidase (beta-lactamase class C family)
LQKGARERALFAFLSPAAFVLPKGADASREMAMGRQIWAVAAVLLGSISPASAQTDAQKAALATIDPLFEKFMRDEHVPGQVYGVVADGKLVYVRSQGVQDIKTKAPVTADTVFRIASMSKNFTALAALKLRDQGKLSFDAPAERYIPELAHLKYPTSDSPKITVRDLLSHSAGLITDNPWGDRQLAMSESDFSKLVAKDLRLGQDPGMTYEYSNTGYALAGRLVTNVSGQNYADYITANFLKPLGMTSTSYDVSKVPAARRAIGYRWQDDSWVEEPVLGPGPYGAMGGLMTSANDYAKYLAWELAAWPPRDAPEDGILKRASVREIQRPLTYAVALPDPGGCARTVSYGLGTIPGSDCVLGFHFSHSGGLPGYGSFVLLLRDRGVAIFAFANRRYAAQSDVIREAANRLVKSGAFPLRPVQPNPDLQAVTTRVAKIYAAGDVMAEPGLLAMNVLLDQDAQHRNAQIAKLKASLGSCGAAEPIKTGNPVAATLTYPCEHGTLRVRVLLAPTLPASLQTLDFIP